jgi:hypothetical protein
MALLLVVARLSEYSDPASHRRRDPLRGDLAVALSATQMINIPSSRGEPLQLVNRRSVFDEAIRACVDGAFERGLRIQLFALQYIPFADIELRFAVLFGC